MKAVVCQAAELTVVDRPEPTPARGQVRLSVLRCGICGSDLHARHGLDDWADLAARAGYDRFGRSTEPVVFGHEFSGEVAEHGPGCKGDLPTGTPVVALPLIRGPQGIDTVGLSAHAPGAYADQVLAEESLVLPVPNGLAPDVAALTEPMAVAWHAVRRGEVGKKQVAIVIGCGPVGLGVILMLKASGVRTVVASDLSPARRALAQACGADVVVDPADGSPFTATTGHGHLEDIPAALELAVGTREKLGRLPVGWWHTWRLAERLGAAPKHPVIFECVGVPGVIQQMIEGAPAWARIVVVGVCMETDRFEPFLGIVKQTSLQFVLAYDAEEFARSLHHIAEGMIDVAPMITATIGLDGVRDAFAELASPDRHAKIVVEPFR